MSITGYMSRLPPPPEPAQLAAVVKALKGAKKPVGAAWAGLSGAGAAALPPAALWVSPRHAPGRQTVSGRWLPSPIAVSRRARLASNSSRPPPRTPPPR